MRTVIIGGVAGGASAAARLRRLHEQDEIIILERGDFISFANCGLPYFIGGEIKDKRMLTLQTPQSFKARFNIDVRVRDEAVAIKPNQHIVSVRNLDNNAEYDLSYDKLILSPGAEPIKPLIEGTDLPHVFTLRNIPDTMHIKDYINESKPQKAVVVGGGYIGVEMAENLANAGLEVSIVELSNHLIAPLDADMAADVHRYLRDKGISLYLGNGVTKITEKEISLPNGSISADMVILSVGVRPETSLARECGITLNQRGSIVVNKQMQTNYPDIYAVGDAVQVADFVTGEPTFVPLAGPANKQGRIAADNICGLDSHFNGAQGSSVIKLFDMTVAATGIKEEQAKRMGLSYEKIYLSPANHAGYYPGGRVMTMKVLFEKGSNRILGAQIVGNDGVDKRIDVIATAMRAGMEVQELAYT